MKCKCDTGLVVAPNLVGETDSIIRLHETPLDQHSTCKKS